jgi:hypothetical protein
MKLGNLSFKTWLHNHPEKHKAVYCRELYPWDVFLQISFDQSQVQKSQNLYINGALISCVIRSIKLQDNRRYRADFRLQKHSEGPDINSVLGHSSPKEFSIIYTKQGFFITAFARGQDPYETIVANFMEGKFHDIPQTEAREITDLLAKSLVSFASEALYPECKYYREHPFLVNTIRSQHPLHPSISRTFSTVSPMFSDDRRFWLVYALNEEIAHRSGIIYSPHCERLLVVYLNPQLSKHHKCNMKRTEIISFHEFIAKLSPEIRAKYDKQIRFLQTGLLQPPTYDTKALEEEIRNPKKEVYEISPFELREALSIMKIDITNKYDAFYVMAGFNLITAYVNRIKDDKQIRKELNLFGELFLYKQYLAAGIAKIILNGVEGADIYIDRINNKNLVYVRLFGYQISFHYVQQKEILVEYTRSDEVPTFKKGDFLHEYAASDRNIPQEWSGIRLQPVAPLLFNLARIYKEKHYRN